MKRRLLRPAVLIPAFVLLSLGAGIGYAAWTQLDTSRVDANMAILDAVPLYPGAREIQRITQTTTGDDALPVPDEIVTSALYGPPADGEAGGRRRLLRREPPARVGAANTGRSPPARREEDGDAPTSFRVDFSRGDDCLSLLTYGMAPGHVGEPTFVLSVQSGDGPCPEPE